jgi:hypothetical protein
MQGSQTIQWIYIPFFNHAKQIKPYVCFGLIWVDAIKTSRATNLIIEDLTGNILSSLLLMSYLIDTVSSNNFSVYTKTTVKKMIGDRTLCTSSCAWQQITQIPLQFFSLTMYIVAWTKNGNCLQLTNRWISWKYATSSECTERQCRDLLWEYRPACRRRRGQAASRALWRAAISICREQVTETNRPSTRWLLHPSSRMGAPIGCSVCRSAGRRP